MEGGREGWEWEGHFQKRRSNKKLKFFHFSSCIEICSPFAFLMMDAYHLHVPYLKSIKYAHCVPGYCDLSYVYCRWIAC